MTKFQKHDIIRWTTPAGSRDMFVVDVWEDTEPKQLLVTDPDHTTQKCYTVLSCDCVLIEREEFYTEPKRVRRPETAKPLIDYPVAIDR